MVALPLLDIVLSFHEGDRSARVAAELVQSALEELRHIENLDESLAPADPSNFDRQIIAILRGMYEDWARTTEGLLERVARIEHCGTPVAAADALRDAHGRTRAMLSISLDRLEQGHRAALKGQGVSIEEVRRELRVGTH